MERNDKLWMGRVCGTNTPKVKLAHLCKVVGSCAFGDTYRE